MATIFISYKGDREESENNGLVVGIYELLKTDGHSVLIHKDDKHPGDSLSDEIYEDLNKCNIFIAFITNSYIQSNKCKLEFMYASNNNEKRCIYVMLEEIDRNIAKSFNIYLFGDAFRLDAHIHRVDRTFNEYLKEVYRQLKPGILKQADALRNPQQNKPEALRNPQQNKPEIVFDKIEIKRDDFFCGREELLQEIEESLSVNKCVCITGMPGVGKSSITAEYLYRQMDNDSIEHMFWIDADSKAKIESSVYLYARKINRDEITDVEASARIFVEYLKQLKNAHIVFDNVENIDHVMDVLNLDKINAKCIITTRLDKISTYEMINVPPFDAILAKQYLKQVLPTLDDQHIEKIIDKCEQNNELLPHKINMIASMLNENPAMTIDKCLENTSQNSLVEKIIQSLEVKNKDAVTLLKYISILEADKIPCRLIERIERIKINQSFESVIQTLLHLNLCKITDSKSPNYGIKAHYLIQSDLYEIFNRISKIEDEIIKELFAILNYLFPKVSYIPSEDWIEANAYARHVGKLVETHADLDAKTASNLYDKLGSYYEHIQRNFKQAFQSNLEALKLRKKLYPGDHPDTAQSINAVAVSYRRLGDYKKSLEFDMDALEMRKRLYSRDGDHPYLAQSLHSVAVSHERLGDKKKALEFELDALEMRKRLFSGDHLDVAESIHSVAVSYGRLDEDKKSLRYGLEGLEMRKRLYFDGDDDKDNPKKLFLFEKILICPLKRNGLKHILVKPKLMPCGYSVCETCLRTYVTLNKMNDDENQVLKCPSKKCIIKEHTLKRMLANIPNAYLMDLFHDNTDFIFRDVMERYRFTLKHLDVEEIKQCVEKLYEFNFEEIEIRFHSLEIEVDKMETRLLDHVDEIEINKKKLLRISIFKKQVNEQYAKRITRRCKEIARLLKTNFLCSHNEISIGKFGKITNEAHLLLHTKNQQDISQSIHAVAVSYGRLGNEKKSLEFELEALEMRKKLYSGGHPDTAKSKHSVAVSHGNLGFDMEALEMRKRLYCDDHPYLAQSLHSVAVSYERLGDDKKSLEYGLEALEMRKRLYSGDHLEIAESLHSIAVSYGRLGDGKKSLEFELEALEMRKRLYSGDNPYLAQSLHSVAVSYARLGNDIKSIEYELEALEMRKKLYSGDHAEVAESMHSLAVSYGILGDDKKSLEYGLEALEMRKRLYSGDHAEVAESMHSLAVSYERLGDEKNSLKFKLEALEMQKRLHSGDHPESLKSATVSSERSFN